MTENVKKFFRICCIYTTFNQLKSIVHGFPEADTNHIEFEIFAIEIGKCILTCEQELLAGDVDFMITPIGWSVEKCVNDFLDLMELYLNQDERVELLYYLSCFNEEEQAEIVIKEGLVSEDYITK